MDFFTVPTLTGRVLFVVIVLSHLRRRLVHFNITAHPTAARTAQQSTTHSQTTPRPGGCYSGAKSVMPRFPCRLHEKRTVTKRINYSGPTGSIRIMKGLRYRYGSMSVQRVTSEELRQIDSGTLYITNKRLVFDGAAKNHNIPYKKVIAFTMYGDGVQVQKDTGRDPYFLGAGDLEMLGLVLDAAISKSHEGV